MDPKDRPEELLLHYVRDHVAESLEDVNFYADRINWIMLFCGAFNPPHLGHLKFLQHSIANVGSDMVFACAFMIPRDSRFVDEKREKYLYEKQKEYPGVKKLLKSPHNSSLPEQDRRQMCKSDERLPAWVSALSEREAINELPKLKTHAQTLGLRIRYTLLRGVESSLRLSWDDLATAPFVDSILLSTYGRQGDHHLQSWNIGSQDWQVLHEGPDPVERYQIPLSDRKVDIRGYVRVIRPRHFWKSAVSSTRIHEVAAAYTAEELATNGALADVVLGWSILPSLREWDRWHESIVADLEQQSGPIPQSTAKQIEHSWKDELKE